MGRRVRNDDVLASAGIISANVRRWPSTTSLKALKALRLICKLPAGGYAVTRPSDDVYGESGWGRKWAGCEWTRHGTEPKKIHNNRRAGVRLVEFNS